MLKQKRVGFALSITVRFTGSSLPQILTLGTVCAKVILGDLVKQNL
jgi:hypothetical protein